MQLFTVGSIHASSCQEHVLLCCLPGKYLLVVGIEHSSPKCFCHLSCALLLPSQWTVHLTNSSYSRSVQHIPVWPYLNCLFCWFVFVVVWTVLHDRPILATLKTLDSFVFLMFIMVRLSIFIEVEILKMSITTATSVGTFSSFDKKYIAWFLFLKIFFSACSYILQSTILTFSQSRSLAFLAFKLVRKLSYDSGKLPSTTVANFFDKILHLFLFTVKRGKVVD